MTAPYQRSSVEGVLANHEKRVGILEASGGVSPLNVLVIAAYVLLDQTNPQTITSSFAYTQAISFDTEDLDTNSIWDAGDPTKLTIPFNGIYLVQATAGFVTNGTGDRGASVYKNKGLGSEKQLIAVQGPAGAAYFWGGFCGVAEQFVAGDFVELYVAQSSGGNLNTGDCWMSIFAVGGAP